MPTLRKPFPDRWWYHRPSTRTRPWGLRVMWATDEYCNPTFYIGLSFLGAWVIRYKRGPIRTEACDTCQKDYGPWCYGCEYTHWGPRCHPNLKDCAHSWEEYQGDLCSRCGGDYCKACDPQPLKNCPVPEEP